MGRRRWSEESRRRQSERVRAYWTDEKRQQQAERSRLAYRSWTEAEAAQDRIARAMVRKEDIPMGLTEKLVERMPAPDSLPSVEWQWSRLIIHGGQLSSRDEIEEVMAVLGYFAERLPPPVKAKRGKAEEEVAA